MKDSWKKFVSPVFETPLNCYMLNVAHVTNDVKWRPIVTTFGTMIENISRMGLYDCHIFGFFDDFMSNINCGIGVLHVKRQILTYFSWRHFSARNVPSLWPWPLTYEGQCFFQWIECNPISILYTFQIDISSNSREIKYQNIGRTHRHIDRQTGWIQ